MNDEIKRMLYDVEDIVDEIERRMSRHGITPELEELEDALNKAHDGLEAAYQISVRTGL